MQVLITSKTKMKNAYCVGGVTLEGEFIRILDKFGNNQSLDTELNIREVWEMDFKHKLSVRAPHIEDVIVTRQKFVSSLPDDIMMINVLNKINVPIWVGSIDNVFDEKLHWTNSGSGYISEDDTPEHSVGFWISDKDLIEADFHGVRYKYPHPTEWRSMKYVGLISEEEIIPAGTLIRVSLARCWQPEDHIEERCYLQLSGWYDL
jgi:hypothetical protein